MYGQGLIFRERCENYLGCKMSGHLDLLCVREWGNGCGYKISSRPLARITTWKMLKWTVRSCYGREEQFWRESSRNAEHDVAMRGCICVNCLRPWLLLHPSKPSFTPFEVKSAIVVGQKARGFTTWFRETLSSDQFTSCRTLIIGPLNTGLWGSSLGLPS